ncbi:MAG: bacillithiol system redox-active protein YtxJ [Candidatus Hydrogenedentes bacterium]|nr:bacillithiol system redox-active protein YtxJ [Candidatus Hydrogenedentota bacterium]
MNPLVTFEDLDTCMAESDTVPVFVFKHSTACPISSGAYRSVAEYESKSHEGDPRVWMVKVIEDRPVSNQIAELLGVQHKSPQLILVHHREAVWSASHHGIYEKRIREVVTENRGRFPTREG